MIIINLVRSIHELLAWIYLALLLLPSKKPTLPQECLVWRLKKLFVADKLVMFSWSLEPGVDWDEWVSAQRPECAARVMQVGRLQDFCGGLQCLLQTAIGLRSSAYSFQIPEAWKGSFCKLPPKGTPWGHQQKTCLAVRDTQHPFSRQSGTLPCELVDFHRIPREGRAYSPITTNGYFLPAQRLEGPSLRITEIKKRRHVQMCRPLTLSLGVRFSLHCS